MITKPQKRLGAGEINSGREVEMYEDGVNTLGFGSEKVVMDLAWCGSWFSGGQEKSWARGSSESGSRQHPPGV